MATVHQYLVPDDTIYATFAFDSKGKYIEKMCSFLTQEGEEFLNKKRRVAIQFKNMHTSFESEDAA